MMEMLNNTAIRFAFEGGAAGLRLAGARFLEALLPEVLENHLDGTSSV